MVLARVMMWLADIDVEASYGFAQALLGITTLAELRRRVFLGLQELVPADLMAWDRVELASGAVSHEAVPAEAEPDGAFEGIVRGGGSSAALGACHSKVFGAAPLRRR
jgi:hypothetical protein